ncbi:lipase family protein [Agromyces albus]|uniref:lipase family protein n=1 Tax=Agromyces albus TaxID=205332 RepID=UPI00278A83C6|nr:lipase family protein [Agromyces albus]MDQ0574171.1 alpha-beta hydrolase superfamily lysophospholipase [Agromyces albus]
MTRTDRLNLSLLRLALGARRPKPARRMAAAVVVSMLAVGSLGGCSFGDDGQGPGERPAGPSSAPPSETPGDVVRSERLEGAAEGITAWRVLYRSTDLDGNDIVVSGLVAAPDEPSPPGGRTVVSWGHPTTGAAERCGPSLSAEPLSTIAGLEELVRAGYVVVATDYAGMGAPGPDSYLVGETEGRNVLDAARAARELDIGASDRVALWGYSQGGHAVLFAAQQAEPYAPELEVQAVAVAAPAIDLAALLDTAVADPSGLRLAAYTLDSYASVYAASPSPELQTILTSDAAAAVPRLAELCAFDQDTELDELSRTLVGRFLAADPRSTEPWAGLIAENTPGTAEFDAPLFVAQGAADTLIRPELTQAFVDLQRGLGTDVTSEVIGDTDHGLIPYRALPSLLPWLESTAPAVPAG